MKSVRVLILRYRRRRSRFGVGDVEELAAVLEGRPGPPVRGTRARWRRDEEGACARPARVGASFFTSAAPSTTPLTTDSQRDQDFDASSGASSSSQSTASAASNATARARKETKTQALAAIVSSASSVATPLLMREDHSSSPEKPHTPEYSKHDEQEEVNALDLESLQLQDKEIAPEKLTRLEKVGSGGFKVRFRCLRHGTTS